jgi:uncharacterized membrane protein
MTFVSALEGVVGGLLLFFVPGYAVAKAVFPEWRVRGPQRARILLELATLSFVTSIGLVVLVGFAILHLSPGGFAASWSDPVLEIALASVAGLAFVVAVVRGAFARTPPAPPTKTELLGEEGAWEVSRKLETLARDERRLEHALRTSSKDSREYARITTELDSVRREREALRAKREEEYAT